MNKDKFIEQDRYEKNALAIQADFTGSNILVDGAEGVDLTIRAPYCAYEALLLCQVSRFSSVLELGAGTGSFTGVLLRTGASVCATDISTKALEVLEDRHSGKGDLVTKVADMECLPFENEQFDFVTSAGCLSYGDNLLVMNEIFRLLKPGGSFVCVDSLNHNPIYRFNRWIHYLRGHRTKSTLRYMPTIFLINKYHALFGKVDVQFFGAGSWACPVFSALFGKPVTAYLSDWLDEAIGVKKSAFKFVMIARKVIT
jgi:ubiquinone/menaquinone biosynthesis C-methylase UbiE